MPYRGVGLSPRRLPDPSVVLRVADAVVTDDDDETLDFLLTGRPLLHLLPGRERAGDERRWPRHFPPRESCPDPVCRSFDELDRRSRRRVRPPDAEQRVAYERAVDLAFAHTDELSGWRLVERMRRQYVDA